MQMELLPDGKCVIHLDQSGKAACGIDNTRMRSGELSIVSCVDCLNITGKKLDKYTLCNHNGDYTIYGRESGYSYTRVLNCIECGEHITLDTLPQRLLTKMYGQMEYKKDNDEILPPIDLCIVFSGVCAVPLSKVFFSSLVKVTKLQGITFHLINIDVPEVEFVQITEMVTGCKIYQRPPVPVKLANRTNNWLGIDAEWSSNWVVENCGNNQFAVLSHFDIFFMRDFLTLLRRRINNKIGMLSQHRPIVLINREAFKQSCFKFRSEGPFRAVLRNDNHNEFFMYHTNDPRSASSVLQTGFDTGELLELELRILGWEVNPMREEAEEHFYHFNGGGRVVNGDELISIRNRARMFIDEYSL